MNENVSPPISPNDAFARIGSLMTSWANLLSERDIARNRAISSEIESLGRATSFSQERVNATRIVALRKSVRVVRSVAHLKRTSLSVAPVLAGSPTMDTGAALMLIANHADFSRPEDEAVSASLVQMIHSARPAQNWSGFIPSATGGGFVVHAARSPPTSPEGAGTSLSVNDAPLASDEIPAPTPTRRARPK